jgi:hypothetical protein
MGVPGGDEGITLRDEKCKQGGTFWNLKFSLLFRQCVLVS